MSCNAANRLGGRGRTPNNHIRLGQLHPNRTDARQVLDRRGKYSQVWRYLRV